MSLKNKITGVKSEKIVFPGRSLCRTEDGIALFSEGLLPGETAEVFVTKDKKTFREGFVKNITQKSPDRTEPLCPSFGQCGGCAFQNTGYENQIKYKQIYTEELLNAFGVKINKILESPEVWHYRNKMEFSFFNSVADLSLDLGLHKRGSFNKYVSVPPCFIADKDFLKAAEIIKRFANENGLPAYNNKTHEGFFRHLVLRKASNAGKLLINIVTNASDAESGIFATLVKELLKFADSIYWTCNGRLSDAVVCDKSELLYGCAHITETLNVGGENYGFNISPFSFFQTNSKGAEILYNEVLRLLNPSGNETLIDLYCGTGTIGIALSKKVKRIIGIEQIPQAVEDAKANAVLNNITNAEFFAMTAEEWSKKQSGERAASAFSGCLVVVDPPRSGLTKDVIKFLLESDANKIIYVSCNPATLARDLAAVNESGKYLIKEITPVDMFPQTYHVETVALLEKSA